MTEVTNIPVVSTPADLDAVAAPTLDEPLKPMPAGPQKAPPGMLSKLAQAEVDQIKDSAMSALVAPIGAAYTLGKAGQGVFHAATGHGEEAKQDFKIAGNALDFTVNHVQNAVQVVPAGNLIFQSDVIAAPLRGTAEFLRTGSPTAAARETLQATDAYWVADLAKAQALAPHVVQQALAAVDKMGAKPTQMADTSPAENVAPKQVKTTPEVATASDLAAAR